MGQVIVDSNKSVWVRLGDGATDTINHYSVAINWDDMLVLMPATTTRPNIVYADWDVKTEEAAIVSNASVHGTIASKYRTKNFDLGAPDIKKQISRVAVVFRNNTDWSGSESVTLKYRLDQGSWVTASDCVIAGTPTDTNTRIAYARILSTPAYHIQLQFESNNSFEILKLIFSYQIFAEK